MSLPLTPLETLPLPLIPLDTPQTLDTTKGLEVVIIQKGIENITQIEIGTIIQKEIGGILTPPLETAAGTMRREEEKERRGGMKKQDPAAPPPLYIVLTDRTDGVVEIEVVPHLPDADLLLKHQTLLDPPVTGIIGN